jgi:hypothetical protein
MSCLPLPMKPIDNIGMHLSVKIYGNLYYVNERCINCVLAEAAHENATKTPTTVTGV